MKYKTLTFILLIGLGLCIISFSKTTDDNENIYGFNDKEISYLNEHKGESYSLGVYIPYEEAYTDVENSQFSYINRIVDVINSEIGININLVYYNEWSKNYKQFTDYKNDLILGINPTSERSQSMVFTSPILDDFYTAYCAKNEDINSLLDVNDMTIGFIADDYVIEAFKLKYPNINHQEKYYNNLNGMFSGIKNNEIDIAVFSDASHIINPKILKEYGVKEAFSIKNLTLSCTLGGHKKYDVLVSAINKVIVNNKEKFNVIINQEMIQYNYKVLDFTEEEIAYINSNPDVYVAYYTNFLPWFSDDPEDGLGIIPNYLEQIKNETGINFKYKKGNLKELIEKGKNNEIDVLMLLKNNERAKYFLFTNALIDEIDTIYGLSQSEVINDVYDLNNKKIAAIKGSWHIDWLNSTLTQSEIIECDTVKDAILCVESNKADYFITPPTIYQYLIASLRINDIKKRGVTLTDTKRAFAITGNNKVLQSIFNKVIPIIDSKQIISTSLSDLPISETNRELQLYSNIKYLVSGITIILLALFFVSIKTYNSSLRNKSLKMKADLIYIDSLTNVYNRFYLSEHEHDFLEKNVLTLIMFDLNSFKAINDNYGHNFGDTYLVSFVEQLGHVFRHSSIIRFGGDEFIVLLEISEETIIKERISLLKENLQNVEVSCGDMEKRGIEVAIGYASKNYDDRSITDLIEVADNRMYLDKKHA